MGVQYYADLPYRKSFWRWPAAIGLWLFLGFTLSTIAPDICGLFPKSFVLTIACITFFKFLRWYLPFLLFISPWFRGNCALKFRERLRKDLLAIWLLVSIGALLAFVE